MKRNHFFSVFVLGMLLGAAVQVGAQQADTAAPPATTAPKPAATKDPSVDTVKKAKQAGYHPKLRKGVTLFCKEQVEIGTHFSTENCIDENQLAMVLDREQAQRDQMSNHTCNSGGACSGK